MFLDNTLSFSGNWTGNVALSANTTADFGTFVDVTGAGNGTLPAIISAFPGNNTAVGVDYGAGDGLTIPHVYITTQVAPSAGAAGNFTFSLSAAPDNGSGAAGTFTTLVTTPAIDTGNFTAGTIIDVQVPPTRYTMGEKIPRFYKLTYASLGNTTISVRAGMAINPQQSLLLGQYSNNYIVV